MKVTDVFKALDIAVKVRNTGENRVPCFVGASGIGKSQLVHQWCKSRGYEMIDRRLATLDSSDFEGLPDLSGNQTVFKKPDWLPLSGKGVLFLDELNRGNTALMNCVMMLLTERKVGTNYELPKDWIIVSAVNPETSEAYDVNTMDAALKNRLTMYNVNYSIKDHIAYAIANKWSETVIAFLASGEWIYREPGQEEFYISPRSWEYLSHSELAGSKEDPEFHHEECIALLGKNIGNVYWSFCHKQKPVLFSELKHDHSMITNSENCEKIMAMESVQRFADFADVSKSKSYRADLISATIQSIANADGKLSLSVIAVLASIMPTDQSVELLQRIALKETDPGEWMIGFAKKYPDIFGKLKESLKNTGRKTE